MSEAPEPKRLCLSKTDLNGMTKDELVGRWIEQEQYLDLLEAKANDRNKDNSELVGLRESEEKLKQQQAEATRRENVLVMRLTTKEQEMQEYANQIQELKQAQVPGTSQLRSTLLDPAVNLMFERMKKGLDSTKAKLEETQNDLSAWKFTPDSNTGKRLMAKCRLLHQENEELGKMISSGRIAKLEGDLALQRNFSEEMKKSQADLDEFLMELDEDVEGMQSTIYYLQQQLRETKDVVAKLQQENQRLRITVTVVENEGGEKAKINDASLTPPSPSKLKDIVTRNSLSPVYSILDCVLAGNERSNHEEDDVEMVPIEDLDQSDVKSKAPFDAEDDDNSMDTTVLPVVDDLSENSSSPRPTSLKRPIADAEDHFDNPKSPRPASPEKRIDVVDDLPEDSRSPRPASPEKHIDVVNDLPEDSRSPRPESPEKHIDVVNDLPEDSRSPRPAWPEKHIDVANDFPGNSRSPRATSPAPRIDVVDRDLDSSPVLEIDMEASPAECEAYMEQRTMQTPSPRQFRTNKDEEATVTKLENEVDEATTVNDRSLTNSSELREQLEEEMSDNELVIDCPQTAVNGNGCSADDKEDVAAVEHSDSESISVSSTEDNSRQTLTPSPRTPETPPPRDSYTPPLPSKDVKMCEGDERTDSVHSDGETNCNKGVVSRGSVEQPSEFVLTATKKPTLNGISSDTAVTQAPTGDLDASVL